MTDWRWIGQALQAQRLARGKSQRWLALRCEVSQAQLSLIERGESLPPLPTIERIATALGARVHVSIVGADLTDSNVLDLSHLPAATRAAIRLLATESDPRTENSA